MRAECLPFSSIPHSTRLFTDFLYQFPKVQQFYPHPPDFGHILSEGSKRSDYNNQRRRRVATILERQNQAWGATPQTLANIQRLKDGAACVVTGQQVGLFGGPLFATFKALSAMKLAAEATAAGVDCIPVFWLATEDHDLAEVSQVTLLNADGSLDALSSTSHAAKDAPISHIRFGPEITGLVEAATAILGQSEVSDFLREAYQPGETLGGAFARLATRLMGRWGVVMVDASDPELHAIAEPLYRSAIERAGQLDIALLERGKTLISAGYHEQVKVTPASTLLFVIENGSRIPIHLSNGGVGDYQGQGFRSQDYRAKDFRIGDKKVPASELLRRISAEPQNFSANVLLRPVVQDYLLPTLAYIGGPAETAYFAQAAVVYEALLGRVTPVVPRFSATLVEPRLATLLDRYDIKLPDLFPGPDHVRQLLAARTLPGDLQSAFDSAGESLQASLRNIDSSLTKLDKTLVDAARNAGSKMQHQLDQLRTRAARAELSRSEVLERHAALLSSALYPRKNLQEREIAGIDFVARQGTEVLDKLLTAAKAGCPDHQILYL
jgi:bacillithiol biosynthesis cysteine-adding enzyme BshC